MLMKNKKNDVFSKFKPTLKKIKNKNIKKKEKFEKCPQVVKLVVNPISFVLLDV